MTPSDFRAAMRLPASANVDRWVPKNAFMEQMKGVSDRKQFDLAVERLDWLATLSPGSVGVATATVGERQVEEVQLFALTARREPTQRLLQIIHQTLPYPLVLLTHWPDATAARLSLLPSYRPQADLLRVDLLPGEAEVALGRSVALDGLPRADLAVLYDSLVERAQALWASQLSDGPFRLPANAAQAAERVAALDTYLQAEANYRALKSAAAKEKRLAQAVELGAKARAAKIALDAARLALL